MHALSLRQPWAALVVAGRKTVEVRRWTTRRLGRILIHAAKLIDERPEAWRHVPPGLKEMAALRGGIIGSVELVRCVRYRSVEEFAKQQALHLNELAWFEGPRMYGFVLANPTPLKFRACAGQTRFFRVADEAETRS